jgi:hypothetical protein
MAGEIAAGSQGVNLAQLIQSISPILLGSGGQTGNTSGTSSTSGSSGSGSTTTTNTSNTTQKTPDPGTLQALIAMASQASANADNPAMTDGVVQNIFRQSAEAFAPTIGTAGSSGLYNTTTLNMLSNDARARATAQAASTVLNYKTTQSQIAQGALGKIADITGSTTSNQTSTAQQEQKSTTETNVANKGNTFQITAPSLSGSSLLQSVGGIAASVLGKKALDAASPFLNRSSDSVLTGIDEGISRAYHGIFGASGLSTDRTVSAPDNFAINTGNDTLASKQIADAAASGVTTKTAEQGVDIADNVGANFQIPGETFDAANIAGDTSELSSAALSSANGIPTDVSPDQITVQGAENLNGPDLPDAGSAASLSAPTSDVTAAAGPDIGTGITPGVLQSTTLDSSQDVVAGVGDSLANTDIAGGAVAGLEGPSLDTVSSFTPGVDGFDNVFGDFAGGSGLVDDLQGFIDGAGNFVATTFQNAGQFIGSGLDNIGNGIADFAGNALSGIGDTIVGGIGSFGVGEVFKGIFGEETGGILGTAASALSTVSGLAGGPTIGGTIAAGVGDLAGAVGLGSTAAELGAGLSAGAAAVGEGLAGAATAAGTFLTEAWPALLAAVAWVVCTELTRQGRIPTKIYRPAVKRFNRYNHLGVKGYLTWGVPLKNLVRDKPNCRRSNFIAYIFLRRAHNLARKEGCAEAKWTVVGAITTIVCYWISVFVGTYLGFKQSWDERRILSWYEITASYADVMDGSFGPKARKSSGREAKLLKVLKSYNVKVA